MAKRGQLTLFMIIGIILILSLGLVSYFVSLSQSQGIKPEINLEQKKQSVAEYVQSCFSDTVKAARNKYGLDQDKIEKYVNDNICKDFSEFEEEDLSITFTGANIDVSISQDTVLASMDYLIMMRLGLSSQSLEEFSFNMKVTTATSIPTQDGVVTQDTLLKSGDGLLELFVAKGTKVMDENGNLAHNPELTIKLTDVKPNPTTYGLGIYEIEPHLSFSEQATIRLRYYDLNLGTEQNLKVIKRPAQGYVWKIVPDQDRPYTENNLVIARINDLSQIALTATCGSEGEEKSIYFYTNYIYIQNCEPCKCLVEDDTGQLLGPDDFEEECSENNRMAPSEGLTSAMEEEKYNEMMILEMRGGTTGYENTVGCEEINSKKGYTTIESVGGTGEFNLTFEIGDGSCISGIRLENEDVDDEIESITVDGEITNQELSEVISSFVGEIEEDDTIFTKNVSLDITNTQSGCSHARFLVNVSGTGISCGIMPEDSIAKCCNTRAECDWEPAAGSTFTSECNKLGFHTLVHDTDDQALIDRHLEVVKEFTGENGWTLNLDYQNNKFDPQAYVSKALELKLRPIIRVEYPVNQEPSDEEVSTMASHINSISGLEYVQFLNEPNIISGFTPQEYASKLKLFHDQITNPNIKIIAGNLAPNQGDATADTLNYIQGMFEVEGVADAFDIWGSHSYPGGPWTEAVQDDTCTGAACPINSIYSYRAEIAKIKENVTDFNKPVIITETGYLTQGAGLSDQFIADNMVKAFGVWNSDPMVIGVTPFILAPISEKWQDYRWVTIPIGDINNVAYTQFFTAVQESGHDGAVCMANASSEEE